MKARLKNSKKWTSFPKEYLSQIQDVFTQNFKKDIGGGTIHVEGRIYAGEILLRVGFLAKGRLKQANCEVSIEYDKQKENTVKIIYLALDCAASMMSEYFQKQDDSEFPQSWKPFKVENKEVYLQYSTINTQLEKQADELLNLNKEERLIEDSASEEDDDVEVKEGVISLLGLDKEDKNES